jgi:hypothetical protein
MHLCKPGLKHFDFRRKIIVPYFSPLVLFERGLMKLSMGGLNLVMRHSISLIHL